MGAETPVQVALLRLWGIHDWGTIEQYAEDRKKPTPSQEWDQLRTLNSSSEQANQVNVVCRKGGTMLDYGRVEAVGSGRIASIMAS